jgi:chromosome condensin MukBEF ATPase and DNA-binding subunit MukB
LESQGIHVEHLTVSVATKADNSGQSDQSSAQSQSGNQDDNRQQQSSNQQSFQQQQQAQNLYQQFNQNNGNKFATAPWLRQANNGSEVGSGTQIQPTASKPEPQHNPNGSISVFA